jgi:hypothetical protein
MTQKRIKYLEKRVKEADDYIEVLWKEGRERREHGADLIDLMEKKEPKMYPNKQLHYCGSF